jgi:NADH-quinone oxidoreductase subunit H
VATLTSILFLGGWLSPVGFLPDGFHWLAIKISFFLLIFCGSAPPFRAIATTRSCAWAGRSSSR